MIPIHDTNMKCFIWTILILLIELFIIFDETNQKQLKFQIQSHLQLKLNNTGWLKTINYSSITAKDIFWLTLYLKQGLRFASLARLARGYSVSNHDTETGKKKGIVKIVPTRIF